MRLYSCAKWLWAHACARQSRALNSLGNVVRRDWAVGSILHRSLDIMKMMTRDATGCLGSRGGRHALNGILIDNGPAKPSTRRRRRRWGLFHGSCAGRHGAGKVYRRRGFFFRHVGKRVGRPLRALSGVAGVAGASIQADASATASGAWRHSAIRWADA